MLGHIQEFFKGMQTSDSRKNFLASPTHLFLIIRIKLPIIVSKQYKKAAGKKRVQCYLVPPPLKKKSLRE